MITEYFLDLLTELLNKINCFSMTEQFVPSLERVGVGLIAVLYFKLLVAKFGTCAVITWAT